MKKCKLLILFVLYEIKKIEVGILPAAYSIRFPGVNFQVPLSNYLDLITTKYKGCLSAFFLPAYYFSDKGDSVFHAFSRSLKTDNAEIEIQAFLQNQKTVFRLSLTTISDG